MSTLPGIESEGGPLIVLPEEAAPAWRGTQGTDYARACDEREGEVLVGGAEFIGAVPVGAARALVVDGGAVLGFTRAGTAGLLVRASMTDTDALAAAAAVKHWQDTGHTWSLPSGRFVAFTAAQSFAAAAPVLRGDLAPGTYRVEGIETNYADSWFTIFRLAPA